MIRQTSLETYKAILDGNYLSNRRKQVWLALYEYGPCTANELFRDWKGRSFVTKQNIHPRLGELRELGTVVELEERICQVTGRNTIVWATTDRLPIKFEKPVKKKCKLCGHVSLVEQQSKLF